MKTFSKWLLLAVLLGGMSCGKKSDNTTTEPNPTDNTTFTNPLLSSGPDPWIIQKDNYYYYTNTLGNRVALRKTDAVSSLSKTSWTTVWTPPSSGAYSKDLWAPELHYLNGKWYVYVAADDGNNANHRIYVLESSSADPVTTNWTMKGKIAAATDKWAIDATVMDYNNQLYLIWSGWEGDTDGQQNLYIAKMSSPYAIEGDRVKISTPTYSWETSGSPDVNEGPEVLKNPSGRVFLVYSASHCSTDDYCLGMLTLKDGGNPLNPSDWTKSANPVFSTKVSAGAYGPGHNSFFKSVDGKENWILYHANSISGEGCGDTRNPRMQKFTWNTDGTPNFGEPVQINTKQVKPSGE